MSAAKLPAAHLLDLAALLPLGDSPLSDAALFSSHPLEFLRLAMAHYADLAYVLLPDAASPAPVPTVIPIHPYLVKQVLTDTLAFRKPEQRGIGKYLFGEGLITSDGNQWKRQRRLLQPAFHREALASIDRVVAEATEEMLAGWKPGQIIDVAAQMTSLTLRILGRVLFGTDFTSESDAIGQAITTLLHGVHQPAQYTPAEVSEALRALDGLVFQLIDARGRMPTGEPDLLSVLLQARDDDPTFMTDQMVRDEVMTFLIGGHETTTVALTWTWYFLDAHAEAERSLHAELAKALEGQLPTIADLARLPFLRMVLEESMRLRPPVWATSREAAVDTELGSYFLPAGTPVLISPYLTHRHPAVWSAPDLFWPPRFGLQESTRHRFAYLPFGGGPRQCIGSEFAMIEAELILAMAASRYRLRLVPGHIVESEPLMTLRIKGGLPVMLEAVA